MNVASRPIGQVATVAPWQAAWPWLLLASIGSLFFYWEGLISLGTAWQRPEYSYGPMVPLITAYMTLREIHHRPPLPASGSRLPGFAVLLLAVIVGLVGNLARINDIVTYGFILSIAGFILMVAGTREGLRFWPGWVHLFFMLPLPQFIYLHVSTQLQSISSKLGVALVDAVGIPVYLDGNIIDLGVYKLQVAEACSGLNYLFPMFSFGWLVALLYRGPNWHRVIIFLSVIPITVLMNSFRIGVIGVMVDSYGIEYAEGFLHFFEGWVIFIACTAILYLIAYGLRRMSGLKGPVLDVDFDGIFKPLQKFGRLTASPALASGAILLLVSGIAWQMLPRAEAANVSRTSLAMFPLQVGEWTGSSSRLDPDTLRVLGADDYLVATYNTGVQPVSLLLTFYNSQTEGNAIHSPQICLPAGGWEVSQWAQREVLVDGDAPQSIAVNRAVIQKGLDRQLVYYWFEQRGRKTASEYEAKFVNLRDVINTGRSDGGLVRLVTPIGRAEDPASADARLKLFMEKIVPSLPRYFPAI